MSDDIDAAAVEAHFGLHAAYDLLEVFFREIHHVEEMARQDDVLRALAGESLGSLAIARGAHTHRLISFAEGRELPDYGQGNMPWDRVWVWTQHRSDNAKFSTRERWYAERVAGRMLHVPLDEASCGGTERYWEFVAEHGLEELAEERRTRGDTEFI